MDEQQADLWVKAFLYCYYSESGCDKLPVRMVVIGNPESDVDVGIIMLCKEHSATYVPTGNVLKDEIFAPEAAMPYL